jgi:hypothetical protein
MPKQNLGFVATPPLPIRESTPSASMGAEERRAFRASVLRAKEQAAAGQVVSGEVVDAWLDSWFTDNELPMPKSGVAPGPKQ